ncbi:DUF6942 family protein [Photobacterium salinisoli]|uniref:DUF6942 family protein n=1 Tax=Photobacterium salinisoli TaxID=1616783 RepID=UPI000EA1421F|nr:hypothetical protein [Photobacterium salinisoli]
MPEKTHNITEDSAQNHIGLGCSDFSLAAYIEHRPAMPGMEYLNQLQPAASGEIHAIGQACGNGWRKVFNVYAKLIYALDSKVFPHSTNAPSWQSFRDDFLLRQYSQTALLFNPPNLDASDTVPRYHIIMGRTYAKKLIHEEKLTVPLIWLDNEFAINSEHRLVICPYFDYRQLSNSKIDRLANILAGFARHA